MEDKARAVRLSQGLDEYEICCADQSQKVDYCADPISYWHGKRNEKPLLSEMALDFLTVQPMSAKYERLFSAARRLMTSQRLSLDAMNVGICLVLRSWYRTGLIEDVDLGLIDTAEKEALDALSLLATEDEWAAAATAWL